MAEKNRFILNDEAAVNSYGFRILTSGIDLMRFKKNPVCLNQHTNDTAGVLGKWSDLRVEDGRLSAAPEFDTEEPTGKEVVRKVAKGIIKGCSMGIGFEREHLKKVNGAWVLEKCELYEASIVAIPSNANAVRLYHKGDQTPLTEAEVGQLCLELTTNPTIKTKHMDTLNLNTETAQALGMNEQATTLEALSRAILKLRKERDTLAAEIEAVKAKEAADRAKAIEEMIDLAIRSGQINGAQREAYLKLAVHDQDSVAAILAALPPKKDFSAGVVPATGPAMTMEAFQKLSIEAQLRYKADHPEEYKKLTGK